MNALHFTIVMAILLAFGVVGELDYQDELVRQQMEEDRREIARAWYERHGVEVD